MIAFKVLLIVAALDFVHWVGDFVLQTHWQSVNKSKRLDALAAHVATYTAVLFLSSMVWFGQGAGVWWFVTVNGALHFATDFLTSRWNARLWFKAFPWDGISPAVCYPPQNGTMHNFFVAVGLDQFIHRLTLLVTFAVFILPTI